MGTTFTDRDAKIRCLQNEVARLRSRSFAANERLDELESKVNELCDMSGLAPISKPEGHDPGQEEDCPDCENAGEIYDQEGLQRPPIPCPNPNCPTHHCTTPQRAIRALGAVKTTEGD